VAAAAVSSKITKLAGFAAAVVMIGVIAALSLTGRWPRSSSLEQVTGNGILSLSADEVARIAVTAGNQTIVFKHPSTNRWLVGDAEIAPAVWAHVAEAIHFLNVSTPRRVLEPGEYDAKKIAEFGLDRPRILVSLVAEDGKASNVAFGEPTPAENSQYVRVLGRPKVYLLSHYVGVEWQIAFEMAARTTPGTAEAAKGARSSLLLLPVSLAPVSAVEIVEGGQLARFERDPAGAWFHHFGQHVHGPGGMSHKADPRFAPLIAAQLDALDRTPVKTVIARHPDEAELAGFGLEHPSTILLLYARDSMGPLVRVEFGKTTPDGSTRYARLREADSVVTVPADIEAHVKELFQLAAKPATEF
jgi:hypothetical protein